MDRTSGGRCLSWIILIPVLARSSRRSTIYVEMAAFSIENSTENTAIATEICSSMLSRDLTGQAMILTTDCFVCIQWLVPWQRVLDDGTQADNVGRSRRRLDLICT